MVETLEKVLPQQTIPRKDCFRCTGKCALWYEWNDAVTRRQTANWDAALAKPDISDDARASLRAEQLAAEAYCDMTAEAIVDYYDTSEGRCCNGPKS